VKTILKSVSRSFYLTIRFLPRPLREPVSLGYLLARATDTIADTTTIPAEMRLTTLRDLAHVIAGEREFDTIADIVRDFAAQQTDRHERILIENLRRCVDWLVRMQAADRADIRTTLQTITRGQQLDLERFGDPSRVNCLQSAAELEEYTYLVAGCVGEFWTRLGFRRLPPFATLTRQEMMRLGVCYGKGLQLINVLRDRKADLKNGRDYLPADETADAPIEKVFATWLNEAEEQLRLGIEYCAGLTNWRVRFATALPGLIGARTIALLRPSGATAVERIKVPRKEVRRILIRAMRSSGSPSLLRAHFQALL
jgi:farnesyl-diphosphate farnesyltransferase